MSHEPIRPDLLCFREGKRQLRTAELLAGIAGCVACLSSASAAKRREFLLELLLRCGELECGLADAAVLPAELGAATDAAAEALLGAYSVAIQNEAAHFRQAFGDLARLSAQYALPDRLTLSRPEGFAYYALHPLDYADRLAEEAQLPQQASIVGIRSIGTTLSAVVAAFLRARGIDAQRITVRPTGDPFERELNFPSEQRDWARKRAAAHFYVVDEGPGISGSSFLSVTEALGQEGVPTDLITLFCSREPLLASLRAPNAAARWQRFRRMSTRPTRHKPADATSFFGAEEWRKRAFASEAHWPGRWLHMERLKYLSLHDKTLFRFDGYAHYGAAVRERYAGAASAGFGPACRDASDGFTSFDMLRGEAAKHVRPDLLHRAAEYCAWRANALPVSAAHVDLAALEHMARINIERALGVQLPPEFRLECTRPVIADAKMQLHEWLQAEAGQWLKLDSAAHGDDHFFPGPCDIAWDVAGIIVEWGLDAALRAEFMSHYEELSGDCISSRLQPWLIAYAAFRLGYCATGALMMAGNPEAERLGSEAKRYAIALRELLGRSAAQIAG